MFSSGFVGCSSGVLVSSVGSSVCSSGAGASSVGFSFDSSDGVSSLVSSFAGSASAFFASFLALLVDCNCFILSRSSFES